MSLQGKIVLVTGASRGIGRGIALEFGRAGATVYITGRHPAKRQTFEGTSTLEEVANEITQLGGKGIAVFCDHSEPQQVEELFQRIEKEQNGRLDVLVNNAYAALAFLGERAGQKFFEYSDRPEDVWDIINNTGLRNHYVCSVYAARLMVKQKSGVILTISSFGSIGKLFDVAYGVGKAAADKMMADMAVDLKESGVAAFSIIPGPTDTETINSTLLAGKAGEENKKHWEKAESLNFTGKCLVKLVEDPAVFKQTGRTFLSTQLAEKYGVVEEDGTIHKTPYAEPLAKYLETVNAYRT